jgi:TolB protein
MSGDVRLHPSRDGNTLLMDVEMDEKTRKGWDGPPPAIWTLDLATQKVTRLTPKLLYAWDCHWLDAADILFTGQAQGEKEQSIWRMSVANDGKDRQRLIKNARMASAGGE